MHPNIFILLWSSLYAGGLKHLQNIKGGKVATVLHLDIFKMLVRCVLAALVFYLVSITTVTGIPITTEEDSK